MTANEFWHSNPRTLQPHFDAYDIKRKEIDRQSYYMGLYNLEAFGVTLANAFRKKGTKPVKYRKKPILQEYEDKNKPLTPEQEQANADKIFHRLEIARFNAELAEKRKQLQGGTVS